MMKQWVAFALAAAAPALVLGEAVALDLGELDGRASVICQRRPLDMKGVIGISLLREEWANNPEAPEVAEHVREILDAGYSIAGLQALPLAKQCVAIARTEYIARWTKMPEARMLWSVGVSPGKFWNMTLEQMEEASQRAALADHWAKEPQAKRLGQLGVTAEQFKAMDLATMREALDQVNRLSADQVMKKSVALAAALGRP